MRSALWLCAVLLLAAAPAGADDEFAPPPAAEVLGGLPEPPPAGLATSEGAIADWQDRRRWRYDTDPLLPLSRGMDDAGIHPIARWPLYLVTVPLDLVQLPAAVLAGLFGRY